MSRRVADAFLRVVAVDQAVRAAQANAERLEIFSIKPFMCSWTTNCVRARMLRAPTHAELAAARSVLIFRQTRTPPLRGWRWPTRSVRPETGRD